MVHLTAAAHMHVAYDLPRVIADNRPGHDIWAEGPSQVDGTLCFFGLSPVFHQSFRRTARRRDVTGDLGIFARPIPRGIVSIAANWVLNLRSTAWSHADILHLEPGLRAIREERMRDAMTNALKDVSNLRPWSGLLLPPEIGLPFAMPYIGDVDLDHAWEGTGATAIVGTFAASLLARQLRRQRRLEQFIDELGRRTNEHVNRAVTYRPPIGTRIG